MSPSQSSRRQTTQGNSGRDNSGGKKAQSQRGGGGGRGGGKASGGNSQSDEEDKLQYTNTKLARASDVESKLSKLNSSSSSSEEKASKLRFELCELHSDVLLTDPTLSLKKDVPGRLWRSCFHGRIDELRRRVGKERNRLKRAANASKEKASEQQKVVDDLEASLSVFLKEAVVLYEYLVEKYQGMLLPPSSQSQSEQTQTQSQISYASTQNVVASPRRGKKRAKGNRHNKTTLTPPQPSQASGDHFVPLGVVPTLHRLLIHLGDLHRYACSFHQADSAYLKASKLAPGMGNPYNQLAVVAQMKEDGRTGRPMTAVALYWYARSLLAVHDPFITSRANLGRLFVVNKQLMEKGNEGQGTGPDDDVSIKSSETKGSKKAQLEQARAAKSAASRKFLGQFVELQGDLFRGVGHPGETKSEVVIDKMDDLLSSFQLLLTSAAFGDALLCKMVCVNAFAVCAAGSGVNVSATDEEKHEIFGCSRVLAKAFILAFGASLAKKVEGAVTKLEQNHKSRVAPTPAEIVKSSSKGGSSKAKDAPRSPVLATPTIRLLLPLILLCDFVSSLYSKDEFDPPTGRYTNDHSSHVGRFYLDRENEFWCHLSGVVNTIQDSSLFLPILGEGLKESGIPKEYYELRGYKPFSSLVCSLMTGEAEKSSQASHKECEGAFVSPVDAILALELPSSTSQSDIGPTGGEAETRSRLFRLFNFMEKHTVGNNAVASPTHFLKKDTESGLFSVLVDDENHVDGSVDDTQEPENQASVENVEDKKDEGEEEDDLVVYKASDFGAGPALLVPSNLLLESNRPNGSITKTGNGSVPFTAKDSGVKESNENNQEVLVSGALLNPFLLAGSGGAAPCPGVASKDVVQAPSSFPSTVPNGRKQADANQFGDAHINVSDNCLKASAGPTSVPQPCFRPEASHIVDPPPGFLSSVPKQPTSPVGLLHSSGAKVQPAHEVIQGASGSRNSPSTRSVGVIGVAPSQGLPPSLPNTTFSPPPPPGFHHIGTNQPMSSNPESGNIGTNGSKISDVSVVDNAFALGIGEGDGFSLKTANPFVPTSALPSRQNATAKGGRGMFENTNVSHLSAIEQPQTTLFGTSFEAIPADHSENNVPERHGFLGASGSGDAFGLQSLGLYSVEADGRPFSGSLASTSSSRPVPVGASLRSNGHIFSSNQNSSFTQNPFAAS